MTRHQRLWMRAFGRALIKTTQVGILIIVGGLAGRTVMNYLLDHLVIIWK